MGGERRDCVRKGVRGVGGLSLPLVLPRCQPHPTYISAFSSRRPRDLYNALKFPHPWLPHDPLHGPRSRPIHHHRPDALPACLAASRRPPAHGRMCSADDARVTRQTPTSDACPALTSQACPFPSERAARNLH